MIWHGPPINNNMPPEMQNKEVTPIYTIGSAIPVGFQQSKTVTSSSSIYIGDPQYGIYQSHPNQLQWVDPLGSQTPLPQIDFGDPAKWYWNGNNLTYIESPVVQKLQPRKKRHKLSSYLSFCSKNGVIPNQFFLLNQMTFFKSENCLVTVVHLPDASHGDDIKVMFDTPKKKLRIKSKSISLSCALPNPSWIHSLSVIFNSKSKLLRLAIYDPSETPFELFAIDTI